MSFEIDTFQSASDPTSDFLQREKQAAGELLGDDALFGTSGAGAPKGQAQDHDDFERRAQDFPALDDDGAAFQDALSNSNGTPPMVQNTERMQGALAMSEEDQFHASYPALDDGAEPHGTLGDDDAMRAWESAAPPRMEKDTLSDLDREPDVTGRVQEETPSGATEKPLARAEPEAFSGSEPFTYDALDEETDALRMWRDQQADDIARREAQAERHRAEAISKAEQEIDEFYTKYNAQKEKNIKKNKESEAQFLQQKQSELAEGTTWTRITKLLDLQNSQSKTIAKGGPGSSDLSRMKELYLRLRREGERAPGAAGY